MVAALTRLCTASLQLHPIQGLLQEVAALSQGKQGGPHGQLQLRLKRHTGRVRVEAELYSLCQDGSLRTSAVPQEAITAQLLAAHAVQHAGQVFPAPPPLLCLLEADAQHCLCQGVVVAVLEVLAVVLCSRWMHSWSIKFPHLQVKLCSSR